MQVYADLHVHIGKAKERFVKITASNDLTLKNALHFAKEIKGINILGIIDSGSRSVLLELEEMLESGELYEVDKGGLKAQNGLLLILGWEIEIGDCHYLAYIPTLRALKILAEILWPKAKNQELSTQKFQIPPKEVRDIVEALRGIFIPAHAFTPHKGFYGKAVDSLYELFDKPFTAIEMGLSSCTEMINGIKELENTTFLSNSDAHSLPKIAREYNELLLNSLTFAGLKEALEKEQVLANFGLDPRLGKYHETGCLKCGKSLVEGQRCSCGGVAVKGVRPRLEELGGFLGGRKRPPYIKQIPLDFLPGVGPKTITKLRTLGTELDVLNKVQVEKIANVTNDKVAKLIMETRNRERTKLQISSGKAGHYGKVQLDR